MAFAYGRAQICRLRWTYRRSQRAKTSPLYGPKRQTIHCCTLRQRRSTNGGSKALMSNWLGRPVVVEVRGRRLYDHAVTCVRFLPCSGASAAFVLLPRQQNGASQHIRLYAVPSTAIACSRRAYFLAKLFRVLVCARGCTKPPWGSTNVKRPKNLPPTYEERCARSLFVPSPIVYVSCSLRTSNRAPGSQGKKDFTAGVKKCVGCAESASWHQGGHRGERACLDRSHLLLGLSYRATEQQVKTSTNLDGHRTGPLVHLHGHQSSELRVPLGCKLRSKREVAWYFPANEMRLYRGAEH